MAMSDALKEQVEDIETLLKLLRSDKVVLVSLDEYKKLKEELESTRIALGAFKNGKR
jgi:PHD/YefM family antitoxin component YafN of YafNO toxin-antitoxin module